MTLKVGRTGTGGQFLSVKDTGPRHPRERDPARAESFGQGSLAHQTAEGGTGLGLPITKGLTELHDGAFELKSKLRYGTEVIITFPRKRVMEALPRVPEPGEIAPEKPRTAWRAGVSRWRKSGSIPTKKKSRASSGWPLFAPKSGLDSDHGRLPLAALRESGRDEAPHASCNRILGCWAHLRRERTGLRQYPHSDRQAVTDHDCDSRRTNDLPLAGLDRS